MALVKDIRDREYNKFDLNDDGDVVVRTSVSGAVEGSFTYSGLRIGGKVTSIGINDSTWTKIPPTALASRNALSIQNYSGEEIKINFSNLVSGYEGIVVPDRGERFYDITDSIELYAKCKAGNVNITIEELA